MYARLITVRGVTDIDGAVAHLEETAMSVLKAQKGYLGLSSLGDRSAGILGLLSLWASPEDREASNSALGKIREEASSQFGGDMTVELFEQAVVQIARPPTVGCRGFVTRISADPGKIDENLRHFQSQILPQIASQPGFRSARVLVNRETGEGVSSSVWDDEQSLKAAYDAALERRPDAESRGVTFGETITGEVLLIDLR